MSPPQHAPTAAATPGAGLPTPPPHGGAGHAAERAFAERLLTAESRAVAGVIDHLGPAFHVAVNLIVGCAETGGNVLVTGLGKSGLIGAKISATLASVGIPSHPVHPTEAAHGDLGRFRRSDVCLALSYSGETEEVVALAEILRQDGVAIITLTAGRGTSALERIAAASLATGVCEEADDLSPAPTCSTTAMLALGDALALAASRRMNFTHDDFARRHPGGTLGGLMRPLVEALRFTVGKNLRPVPDDRTVAAALADADTGVRRPGATLLVDPATGVLTGIFTDADLRRLILAPGGARGVERPIAEVMTRSPSTLPHTALIRDAVRMVREQRRDEIPVVDDAGRPVGILDVQDLVAMKVVRE